MSGGDHEPWGGESSREEPSREEPPREEPSPEVVDSIARAIEPWEVRAVRLGHGANCSSVGSVVDVLFVGAAAASAILAAVCAAMRDEPVRVVGAEPDGPNAAPDDVEPEPEPEPEPALPDEAPIAPSPEEEP